ncbi:hypothetical protein CWE13_02860 [Aliidiomarina shirensis]|uniref:Uncharacterized protein n=1 Tax=Aliidiomarina shirensis TaxID=1048642 RepID=A0A432WXV9_9GAMM|nr:hypothetical protein [Aliidiomarina shirensis]RUO38603.1 hypothetical protein CWE13_02860 [Aliidiomarina shirensis]
MRKAASYWKLAFGIFVLIVTAVVTVPWHVKWWPPGYMAHHVNLWLREAEIKELLVLAEDTPYDRIFWINSDIGGDLNNTGSTSMADIHNADIGAFQQVQNPDISALTAVAKSAQISGFYLFKRQGIWTIEGYHDVLNHSDGSKHVIVHSFYQHGGPAEGNRCSREIIEASDSGRCHIKLFGKWVMQKSWVSVEDTPI